jgi:hypothetical protein
LNFRRVRRDATEHGGPEALRRAPVAELLNAWFEDAAGEKVVAATQGEPCWIRLDVRFHTDTEDPVFSIALKNDLGHTSFAASSQLRHGSTGRFVAGGQALVGIRFQNWLGPGRYRLTASITRAGVGADAYDLREDISSIIVTATGAAGGAADLPHSFEIELR